MALRLQDVPMPQRPLQGRLHLHLLELCHGEVQMSNIRALQIMKSAPQIYLG